MLTKQNYTQPLAVRQKLQVSSQAELQLTFGLLAVKQNWLGLVGQAELAR